MRALLLVALVLPGHALATVPDAFGIGARWQGAGAGGVAVVEDGTAALVNPAGLSRVRRPTAAVGFTVGIPRFEPIPPLAWDTNRDGTVDASDPPLEWSADPPSMAGVQVQASRNVGGKFGLGLTAYVPTSNLIRFHMMEPELPHYVMWDNRPQRFVAAAGIGGEVLPGWSLGASVDVLAKARITVATTIDATIAGDAEAQELEQLVTEVELDVHEIDFRVVPALAPVFGTQLDVGRLLPALDGLVLGAMYHGAVGLPIDVRLDIQANAELRDLGELEPYLIAAVAEADLALFDHYVPQRVNLGLAYRRANALTVYADARWTDWRGLVLNVARVEQADVTSPLIDIDDAIVDGNPHSFVVRAVWGLRMGSDLHLPEFPVKSDLRYVRLSFRGGFGYEPTPLLEQGTTSALLDSDRTLFTLGAGVETWDPFELVDGAIRFDAFFQYHVLARDTLPREAATPTPGYPLGASSIPIGGSLVVAGGQWSFEY